MQRTWMQKTMDVAGRDAACLGIARKYRADNVAFVAGTGPQPAVRLMRGVLADRLTELGVVLPNPAYLGLVMAALCGRVA